MRFDHSMPPRIQLHDVPVSERERLPSSLHELLETDIDHAGQLDRGLYLPYSENWHHNRNGHLCEVCLAGSLIAGFLDNPPSRTLVPDMFSRDTERKLETVDSMRCSQWLTAFEKLYVYEPSREIASKMQHLPRNRCIHFYGWDEFDLHLRSLRRMVPRLREIDTLAGEAGYVSFDCSS